MTTKIHILFFAIIVSSIISCKEEALNNKVIARVVENSGKIKGAPIDITLFNNKNDVIEVYQSALYTELIINALELGEYRLQPSNGSNMFSPHFAKFTIETNETEIINFRRLEDLNFLDNEWSASSEHILPGYILENTYENRDYIEVLFDPAHQSNSYGEGMFLKKNITSIEISSIMRFSLLEDVFSQNFSGLIIKEPDFYFDGKNIEGKFIQFGLQQDNKGQEDIVIHKNSDGVIEIISQNIKFNPYGNLTRYYFKLEIVNNSIKFSYKFDDQNIVIDWKELYTIENYFESEYQIGLSYNVVGKSTSSSAIFSELKIE